MVYFYRDKQMGLTKAPPAPLTSTSPAVQQHTAHRTTILNQPQQIGFRGFGTPTILNISLYLYVYNASVKWPTVKVIEYKYVPQYANLGCYTKILNLWNKVIYLQHVCMFVSRVGWVPWFARVPPFSWWTCPYLQTIPKVVSSLWTITVVLEPEMFTT